MKTTKSPSIEAAMRRLIVAIGKIVRQEAQAEAINAIVRTIDETLGGALLPTIEDESGRARLKAVAADLAADHLWMVSPKLRHPSFEAEDD